MTQSGDIERTKVGPGPVAIPALPASERDNIKAVFWALLSVFGASLMTLAVRGVTLELDSRMAVMFRAGLATILLAVAIVLWGKLRHQMQFSRPWSHILRGALIGVSTNLGFYTLAHIPLAPATVLFFTAPIFATLLGTMFHGEPIGPRRILAILTGFGGALIILRPGFEAFHPAMLAALGSSALFAIALSLSRNLANADGALSTYFSSVVMTLIVTLPVALPVWQMPASGITWLAVVILVVTSAIRGVADIQAYRFGEAAILAPVMYLRLVLIGVGAYFIFGETIDLATGIGAAVIVAATLYIAQRESRLRRQGQFSR